MYGFITKELNRSNTSLTALSDIITFHVNSLQYLKMKHEKLKKASKQQQQQNPRSKEIDSSPYPATSLTWAGYFISQLPPMQSKQIGPDDF